MSDGLGVREVVVRYPGAARPAVDAVSLDVPVGEVVALLGPSGCGKSSLLRAVAGLEPLAAGDVAWDGVGVTGVPVHRRGFGLLFQDGQLFGHLDVAGNVAYGLAGRPRAERAARVAELLDLVGLPGTQRRDVATLSGGERQRVALARALAPRPRLLLLDEPLSALDRSLRERLALDLRDVLVATGTTALFVTHDHDEAFAVADRVAVMDAGRLLQVAAPAALWSRPASRRVAEFLGYEAFVEVPADRDGAEPAVRALVGAVEPRPGAGTTLALAAGALVVRTGAAGAGDVVGTVTLLRSRRGRTEVVVDVPGVGRVTAFAPAGWSCEPGTSVLLRADPAAVAPLPGTWVAPDVATA
ncbi:ABC transporter ATP-binding protein [Cellulomonas telluris]|uniref:ABC transporter ATP-binding protein n=1 Tax=Cellulomonas telluris TaxID=2306636 RepID=UPI0010A90AA0|nr:ABC transporter ATP-binding protein [Cellulomonas telluris]